MREFAAKATPTVGRQYFADWQEQPQSGWGAAKLGAGNFESRYPDPNLPLYNDDLWQDLPAGVLR